MEPRTHGVMLSAAVVKAYVPAREDDGWTIATGPIHLRQVERVPQLILDHLRIEAVRLYRTPRRSSGAAARKLHRDLTGDSIIEDGGLTVATRAPRNEPTATAGESAVMSDFERIGWGPVLNPAHHLSPDI